MWNYNVKISIVLFLQIGILINRRNVTSFNVDYRENAVLIEQKPGNDVELNCKFKGLFNEDVINRMKVRWFFQQCGVINQKPCESIKSEDWTPISCVESFCSPLLRLQNVTEKDSGVYKCTIYPYKSDDVTTLKIQLVRTYQLDIKNSTMLVPEFLDGFPENKTVSIGSQVVFQCRVRSQVYPTIKWFKRIPDTKTGMEYNLGQENFNSHIVQYNGEIYELLEAAREKNVGDEIYLSKLILNGVRIQDEGYYACVAISYRGYKIREAYLAIDDEADDVEENYANYWESYDTIDEHTEPRRFWLLFLMPLGLAVLPILFWVFYIVNKKYFGATNLFEEEEQRSLQ